MVLSTKSINRKDRPTTQQKQARKEELHSQFRGPADASVKYCNTIWWDHSGGCIRQCTQVGEKDYFSVKEKNDACDVVGIE